MAKNKAWTVLEEQKLVRLAAVGAGAELAASALDRPIWSVRKKATKLRVSLRRAGEHRGKVLGEPRSGSWQGTSAIGEVRKAIANGRVDVTQLERFARARLGGAPTCPACGLRPIDTPAGFCRPCVAGQILRAYRDTESHRAAERALDAARSERRRRKKGTMANA